MKVVAPYRWTLYDWEVQNGYRERRPFTIWLDDSNNMFEILIPKMSKKRNKIFNRPLRKLHRTYDNAWDYAIKFIRKYGEN